MFHSTIARFSKSVYTRLPRSYFRLQHPKKAAIFSVDYYHSSLFFSNNQRWICSTRALFRDGRKGQSAAIAINKQLVELGRKKDWKGLLELAAKEQNNFNNVNCATVMSQLGRIRSFNKADPLFLAYLKALAKRIEERGLPWIKARQAGNIIHAIGKTKLNDNESAAKILDWISKPDTAAEFVEKGDPQAVAIVAWAFATLGFHAPHLFAEIDHRSKLLVEEGDTQSIANTAWACATLSFQAPNLFAEIDCQSEWLVKEGNPQEVANTAWACATLGFEAPRLFVEIDRHSEWLVEEGNPQNVANVILACATIGFDAPCLLAFIEGKSKQLVETWHPQDFSNTAWAFAKLGAEAPMFFAEIDRRSGWLVKKGKPQAVANTAWACARLGVEAPHLFAEIESGSKWLVTEGDPQNVANTAWALAKLGYKAPNLFAEIDRQSSWLVREGNPQEVANTAWACATIGFEAPNLFVTINQNLGSLIEKGNTQNIANTCYAISALGMRKDESKTSLAKLWERAIELHIAEEEDFCDEDLNQLAQTLIFAKASGVQLSQPPEKMTTNMESSLHRFADNSISRSTNEVSKLLKDVGFMHEEEVTPDKSLSGGMLAIDMACTKRMIAIEFDGPSHFLKALGSGELTSTENGATKAKRRFLEQLGWTVINLDYRDYIKAKSRSNEKEWLRKKLKASGVSLSR